MTFVGHWNITHHGTGDNLCFHCPVTFNCIWHKNSHQICSRNYKQWRTGCAGWLIIAMVNSLVSPRLRLWEHFDSDPFGTLRSMIGFKLSTENLRQGSFLDSTQACSNNPGCSTSSVKSTQEHSWFLWDMKNAKNRANPLIDYFRSCGIM